MKSKRKHEKKRNWKLKQNEKLTKLRGSFLRAKRLTPGSSLQSQPVGESPVRKRIEPNQRTNVVRAYLSGKSLLRVANQFGASVTAVRTVLKLRGVKPRPSNATHTPTPEDIAERVEEIQEGWDDKTREARAGANRATPVEFPFIKFLSRDGRRVIDDA